MTVSEIVVLMLGLLVFLSTPVVAVVVVRNQLRTDRELVAERAQIDARIARVEAINDRLAAQLKRRGR